MSSPLLTEHGPRPYPETVAGLQTGERFRIWREHIGLSQRELGERVGWPRQEVSRLEIGPFEPTSKRLQLAVEDGLGITMQRYWGELPGVVATG